VDEGGDISRAIWEFWGVWIQMLDGGILVGSLGKKTMAMYIGGYEWHYTQHFKYSILIKQFSKSFLVSGKFMLSLLCLCETHP
jgi:hypothetical protein